VLIIGVVACLMAMSFASLGIDIGRYAVEKKSDQKVADLAALDAARAIGLILNSTNQAGYDTAAQTAASASAVRNGFTANGTTSTITAVTGSVDSTNTFVQDASASAVRVIVASRVTNQFIAGVKDIKATAVALVGSPIAAFSVGSTLASLDTSRSFLDPVLKGWLGATGSLSAVSYDGLASGNVSLAKLQTALLSAGYNVGTVNQLLTTDVKVRDLLTASASALGTSTAKTEINDLLAASISSTATIKLNQLLNVATPSDSAVLSGTVNVYQLVTGSAELMNGSSFAAVSTGLSLGNYGSADVSVKLISPAQIGIGPVGTTAENAQGVVKLVLHVKTSVLTALLPTLGTAVDVTLIYNVGEAKGTLSSIVCGASPSIGVSVNTSSVSVTGSATAALTGTITVSPSTIAASGPTALTFNYPSEFTPASKRVPNSTNSISSTSVTFSGSGSLLSTVVNAVTNPVATVVSTVLTNTLSTAITPALKALGIDVGAADVSALGIFPDPSSCGGHPRLAQ
jgi:uncharacterized membrane protein